MGEVSSFAVAPTPLDIDGVVFPAFASPPDSSDSSKPPLFLAGAGLVLHLSLLLLLFLISKMVSCYVSYCTYRFFAMYRNTTIYTYRSEGTGHRRQVHQVHRHRRLLGGIRYPSSLSQVVRKEPRRTRRRHQFLLRHNHRSDIYIHTYIFIYICN